MLIKTEEADPDRIKGLRPNRAPVLPGGVAILSAAFDELGIETMKVSDSSGKRSVRTAIRSGGEVCQTAVAATRRNALGGGGGEGAGGACDADGAWGGDAASASAADEAAGAWPPASRPG